MNILESLGALFLAILAGGLLYWAAIFIPKVNNYYKAKEIKEKYDEIAKLCYKLQEENDELSSKLKNVNTP